MSQQGAPRCLAPWRRGVQGIVAAAALMVPFVQVRGAPLLRIDIPGLSLYIAGQHLRIADFHLLWLAVVAAVFSLVLVTMLLGRVWCGWLCPQTILADAVEWLARRMRLTVTPYRLSGAGARLASLHLCIALLALLVGADVVWFFVPPREFFSRLMAGSLTAWPLATMGTIALIVYLDLAFVRRAVCTLICPYGRFQTALMDRATLCLQFLPTKERPCIDCRACLRACPMGIDIRKGFQVECINCARCLDACRMALARRGRPGIIRYTFGRNDLGPRALLSAKLIVIGGVWLAVATGLVIAGSHRAAASIEVRRATATERLLADGRRVLFFTLFVANHGERASRFTVQALLAGQPLELRGQATAIELRAGERQQLGCALLLPATLPRDDHADQIRFSLRDEHGRERAHADYPLPLAADNKSTAPPPQPSQT